MRNSDNSRNTIKLFIINILIISLVIVGFIFMKGNSQIVDVKVLALNVRESPSVTSDILTQVHQEDQVRITDKKGDWYQIITPDKTEGWVADWLIFDGTSGPFTQLPAIINQRSVDLKQKDSKKSKTLSTLKRKQKVTVTLEKNGWARVLVGDQYGFVPSETVSIRKKQRGKIDENTTLRIATDTARLKTEKTGKAISDITLEYGEQVTFNEEQEHWYKVTTQSGETGYLHPFEVTSNKPEALDKRPATPMAEYRIMLDPGHGGSDPGAESNNGETLEKNVTLATAKEVRHVLEKNGFTVMMTRDKDDFVPLSKIADISNKSHADAFISFHYDSTPNPNEGSGTTTFYLHKEDQPLAQAVNDKIASLLPLDNRGFGTQDYQVLRENKRPAILLELGYINNDLDAQYAQHPKYHERVAKAVYEGLLTYFNPEEEDTAETNSPETFEESSSSTDNTVAE